MFNFAYSSLESHMLVDANLNTPISIVLLIFLTVLVSKFLLFPKFPTSLCHKPFTNYRHYVTCMMRCSYS